MQLFGAVCVRTRKLLLYVYVPGNCSCRCTYQETAPVGVRTRKLLLYVYVPGNCSCACTYQETAPVCVRTRKLLPCVYVPGNCSCTCTYQETAPVRVRTRKLLLYVLLQVSPDSLSLLQLLFTQLEITCTEQLSQLFPFQYFY